MKFRVRDFLKLKRDVILETEKSRPVGECINGACISVYFLSIEWVFFLFHVPLLVWPEEDPLKRTKQICIYTVSCFKQ